MSVMLMNLRRDDQCECGAVLTVGSTAGWDRSSRKVICTPCLELAEELAGDSEPLAVDVGVPGASMQREFERRLVVESERPRLNELVGPGRGRRLRRRAAMHAFALGAEGERRVAHHLARTLPPTEFLFNRRYGRGKGDIDALVIVPSGVWIIDAKLFEGERVRGSRRRLVIGGRHRPRLRASMRRQIAAVEAAMAAGPAPAAPVRAVYCFLEARLPRHRLVVDDVPVLSLSETTRALQRPGPLGPMQRAAIHRDLAERFPIA